jgi:hypothetical protein
VFHLHLLCGLLCAGFVRTAYSDGMQQVHAELGAKVCCIQQLHAATACSNCMQQLHAAMQGFKQGCRGFT